MNRQIIRPLLALIMLCLFVPASFEVTKTSVNKAKPKTAVVKKAAPVETEWAAKVNGEIISMEWFNRVFEASKKQMEKVTSLEAAEESKVMNDTKKTLLEQMIESVVLIQWAEREGIEVSENSIKYGIKQLKKGFPSASEFYKSLKEQGMSQADLERDIRKQIIKGKLIETRAKNLAVSDEEMKAFYDKNSYLYEQDEKLQLRQEFFKDPLDAAAERSKLMSKKEFAGEDIGLMEKGQLPVYDDSTLFALDKGQISNIVSGEAGYYIFKVEEKLPARNITLADAKDSIRKFLLKEKARQKYMMDLQEEKANAKIILNEKLGKLF